MSSMLQQLVYATRSSATSSMMYLVPFVADSVRTRAAAADPLQKRFGFNSGSEAELCRTGLFGSGLGLKLTKISGLIWA